MFLALPPEEEQVEDQGAENEQIDEGHKGQKDYHQHFDEGFGHGVVDILESPAVVKLLQLDPACPRVVIDLHHLVVPVDEVFVLVGSRRGGLLHQFLSHLHVYIITFK